LAIEEVLTDNGSCYRSRLFAASLGEVKHRKTLSAPDQWKSRTLQPHHARRVGLREALCVRGRAHGSLQSLLAHLQSPPQPLSPRG
jgi:hypothetical protein